MLQFGRNQLKLCKHGWMLFYGPYIGKCFELYGQYSESEVRMMQSFLRAGDTCIDVGANIGDLTLPMARLVGPTGRVYAVESHPDNYNVLCTNLALNGITQVKPLNYFIADSPGIDTAGPWGKYGYVSEIWETSFLKIDHLALNTCALIKVDVDGKEYEVLKSAENTIKTCRPAIYFENDDKALSGPLLKYVLGLGYDVYFHPAPIFDADNFFGNPVNHWAPRDIQSLMMIAIPQERAGSYTSSFRKVQDADDWWG